MNTNENLNPENSVGMEADYVQAIQELRANSVDKSAYDKLRDENRKLLNTLTSGGSIETPTEKVNVEDLRKELFTKELSNLEFCEKALKLREAVIEDGGPDPFIASGKMRVATDQDIAAANKVAGVLQSCIDIANGDSQVFTMELQRVMKDAPVRRK